MHEGKVIESIVRRKLSEMVDETRKAADLLSPSCERDDAQRIKNALDFLTSAQKAMMEGFSAVLEGSPRPSSNTGDDYASTSGRGSSTAGEGSSNSADQRRFDPMDMLSKGLERFDAETVGKGLDVLHGFVRMIDDVKRKNGRR